MPRNPYRSRIVLTALTLSLACFAAIKFVSFAQKKGTLSAPNAVTVTDTVGFAPGGDLNVNGKANPGDKLEGTITVSASGAAATGTKVTIPISSLLTLDNTFGTNGVMVSPLAANDTYAATGNIAISQPTGAGSLLSNDVDPVSGNNTGLVATAGTISSSNCSGGCSGNVTINSDGSFTYVSPPNFTGADTFSYTVTSASGGTAVASATVNVSDRVVFVSSGGGGNCRPATPCSLATADALAAPTAGKDLVYVLSGTYSSATFTMNPSQNLVGQGVGLAQALSDAGITLAANSTNPGTAASTNPIFNNAATTLTLSTNNLVERFALNPSAGSAIVGTSITTGTDNINNIVIGATTAANGINLTANSGGTFNFSAVSVTTASGTALTSTGGGTVNVASSGSTLNAVSGQAINANGVTLAATFTSVSAGAGTNGIALTGVAGTSSLGTGTITGATGSEFFVSGGNPAVTYGGNVTQNNAQRVVDIQGTTGNTITLSGTVTGGSTSLGVHVGDTSAIAGNATFTTLNLGTSGSRMTNQAITIGANTSASTIGLGTVAVFTSNVQGLGATNFDGTLNSTSGTFDCSGATAINIDGPAGLTTLGMTLTSVTSAGGTANGISLQDTNGSFLVNGDGSNTTKGGNASGGTISNKSGADGSTASGIGVFLNNASGVTLRRMTINGTMQNNGILTLGAGNFTFQYGTVGGTIGTSSGGNDLNQECPVEFGRTSPALASGFATGAVSTIDNSLISGGIQHNVEVYQDAGTASLTISNSNITSNGAALGSDGINIESSTTGNLTVSVQNCLFDNNKSQALQASSLGSSTLNLTINGSTVQKTTQGNEGFVIQNATNSHLTTHVTNNTFTGILGTDILVGQVAGNATSASSLTAVVTGNTMTVGAAGGPYPTNRTLIAFLSSTNGQVAPANILIDSNTINTQSDPVNGLSEPLFVSTPDANTSPSFTATVTNNTVNINDPGHTALRGIAVQSTQTTSAGCADVRSNKVAYSPSAPAGVNGMRVRQAGGGTMQLEQGASAGTAATVLAANNPLSTTEVVGTVTVVSNSTCQTAPTVPDLGGLASLDIAPVNPLGGQAAEIAFAARSDVRSGDELAAVGTVTRGSRATAASLLSEIYSKLAGSIEPTAYAAGPNSPDATSATVTVDGGGAGFTIPAGSSITIKYRATVNNGPFSSGVDTIDNQATATGSFGTVTSSPVTSIALDAAPDLSITDGDSASTTQPGVTNSYTLTYANGLGSAANNLQAAAGATVSATVPANTTFNSVASSPGWSCAPNNNAGSVCTNTITGPIAVNTGAAAGTLTFAVDVAQLPPAATTKIDLASVSIAESPANFNGTDLNTANNSAATDSDNIIGVWNGTGTDWTLPGSWSNNTVPTTQNVAIPADATNAPAIPAATNVSESRVFLAKNLTIGAGSTLTIGSSIALGSNKVLGAGTLELANGATLTFTLNQGWVVAALKRNYVGGNALVDAPLATVTYPVGTGTGYFPVDVTPTAGSAGSLSVQAFDGTAGVVPPLDNTKTLQRYWTLASTGAMTADVKFSYGATATPGTESNYKPQRVTGGAATSFIDNCPAGPCVDETNNFIFMPSVSTFNGNWTASELAPTAATVAVSGRVFAAEGTPLRNARVILDDGTGHPLSAITNSFGYYHFDEVQSGSTYMMNAAARGYTFTPRVVQVSDQLSDVDFTALP